MYHTTMSVRYHIILTNTSLLYPNIVLNSILSRKFNKLFVQIICHDIYYFCLLYCHLYGFSLPILRNRINLAGPFLDCLDLAIFIHCTD